MLRASRPLFNPRSHITAGQLRRLGFYLSEMIPDSDYVRRIAVGLDDAEHLHDGSATLGLKVIEPFISNKRRAMSVA
jgi:hypothetical protein